VTGHSRTSSLWQFPGTLHHDIQGRLDGRLETGEEPTGFKSVMLVLVVNKRLYTMRFRSLQLGNTNGFDGLDASLTVNMTIFLILSRHCSDTFVATL
jgi:hypothetical protein